jgi:hypothetical protein
MISHPNRSPAAKWFKGKTKTRHSVPHVGVVVSFNRTKPDRQRLAHGYFSTPPIHFLSPIP